jgi:hypothetical protein
MKPKLVKQYEELLPDHKVAGGLKAAVGELLRQMIEAEEKNNIQVDFKIDRDGAGRLMVSMINVTKKL